MQKIRCIIAAIFVICGLGIGILGSYECIATKHYKGEIPLDNPMVSELAFMYPSNVAEISSTLHYDIVDTKRLGLPYTMPYINLLWLAIPIGLAYVSFGVATILKKDLIFRRD